MKKDFLIWNKIEKKFNIANNEINNILEEINKTNNKIILKGLFTYGVSTLENIMTDILRDFIIAFPNKIPEKSIEVTKNELINERDFLIEKTIDKTINNLSYGTLDNYLTKFSEILSIDKIPIKVTNQLIEIKETRNLIIHNNLKVNTVYLSKCKPDCIRANVEQVNKELPFDKTYASKSIEFCKQILSGYIYKPLKDKYSTHTKIKAMKEIWDYLFDSIILKFDDYWEYNIEGKLLHFQLDQEILNARLKGGYSTSEKILLVYILMHYSGSILLLEGINIDLFNPGFLHNERRIKFLYLQDILFRYPELFCQD